MGKKAVTENAEDLLSGPAHSISFDEVVKALSTDIESGLSKSEASSRTSKYGENQLDEGPGVQPVKILINQVANGLTLVLIMAMVASFAIMSWIEGGVITFVILLNIVVGFFQEYSAEKTLNSIRALGSPTAKVIREGRTETIPTKDLVPGDMVELSTGSSVPADIRLVECVNLETDEALLTGESLPVAKVSNETFDAELGAGDRLNVAFSSSTVTKGRGRGVIFATGMNTEIGKIAAALKNKDSKVREPKRNAQGKAGPHRYAQAWGLTAGDAVGRFLGVNVGTPLQRKLSKLAILLFGIAIVCAIIVMGVNNFSNEQDVIIYAVATGLSMIPASLIVVLTITMAVGTKRMSKRNVLVRKLDSLEALGAVTNICSDKTGTLTQGRMLAKAAWVIGHGTFSVGETNDTFDPTGAEVAFHNSQPSDESAKADVIEKAKVADGTVVNDSFPVQRFMNCATFANVAHVTKHGDEWQARGDPTEIAIQVFASRFNWSRQRLVGQYDNNTDGQWKDLAEFPFDSDVKRMSVLYQNKSSEEKWVYTKGALERVLPLCVGYQNEKGEDVSGIDDDLKATIDKNVDALASQGLRVLTLATRKWTRTDVTDYAHMDRKEVEQDLIFVGLIGLYDPPRPESAGAVAECGRAGIVVHMLTGDHPGTAEAIAKQVGIVPTDTSNMAKDVRDALVMTAMQFDKLSDDQVDALPVLPRVIARCTPQTKVRMIEALHRRKRFAAMTGDGVNDSPSLVRADVGIAMGMNGSDVAKDASDIVLTDDNFASILNAVEEGRRLFDNIKRFVLHVLAENIAQAATLLIGLAFKDASGKSVFPLAPVQILWIIMATSGMPDMGLGLEQAAPDIMERPPHDLDVGVFSWELIIDMVVYGIWMSCLCLASFTLVVFGFGDGNLGVNCNDSYSESCDLVFRARATTFISLTWFALFLAWEMVSFRRSFFRQKPKKNFETYRWYMVFYHWWQDSRTNPFLFWAIMAGFVTIFPTLYIPVINHKVFKHTGISWEWAIVIVEALLFFGGCELYKWIKRAVLRRIEEKPSEMAAEEADEMKEKRDLEKSDPAFSRADTQASSEGETVNEKGDKGTEDKISSAQ